MEDIEKEFRAQIELAKKKIPSLSHISAHMGCTELNDSVRNLTKKLAVEYGLDIDPKDFGVKGFEYEIKGKTIEEKVKGFIEALKNLQPGNTYIFVEHPGLDTDELRAIHHIGNETVAIDRQAVTSLWTNKDVKKAIKEKGIQLISYREVRGEK